MLQKQQKRQAVSGVLAAVLLIGITVSLAALVLTFGSDFTENALVVEPITIENLSVKNSGTTSYIHATVKNTGNGDLNDMQITIFDNGSELDVVLFSQSTIGTGETSSTTQQITNSSSTHYLPYGKEVLVQIKADTPTGSSVETDPATVRVSKN
jgi:flagellin-like protein